MISSLRGRVLEVHVDSLVLDVGGVGLLVSCTPQTALAVRTGAEATLATTLIVREDSLTLYGFATTDQRVVFDVVQSVSGIGPRTALAVVATMDVDELSRAIADDDLTALTRVPGIGRKGAARMVLELKDRLRPATGSPTSSEVGSPPWQGDVQAGLMSLGWNQRQADWAVTQVHKELSSTDATAPPEMAELLRAALRHLDRSGSP